MSAEEATRAMLEMTKTVLVVSGGIAAYKACEIVRRLRDAKCDVHVVPTDNALRFVGAATWEALSGHPVTSSVFEFVDQVNHVALGRDADLVIAAPATADFLTRAAAGRADDLASSVLLVARCPILMVPAMHTQMWTHPATVANVGILRSRGTVVMNPGSGRLTGPDSGPGRLPDPQEIVANALSLLEESTVVGEASEQDLSGLRIAVSAGGTHEALDPVRFLGNSSSGKMGVALAQAAVLRGAAVDLVSANVHLPIPSGVSNHQVASAEQLAQAMSELAPSSDIVVMAAAVADFRPAEAGRTKIKKHHDSGFDLQLVQTPDVLMGLTADRRPGQVIVGFAAETAGNQQELHDLGRKKLARKGADLLVLNDVSGGRVFGEDSSRIEVIDSQHVVLRARGTKLCLAHQIWDCALNMRRQIEH